MIAYRKSPELGRNVLALVLFGGKSLAWEAQRLWSQCKWCKNKQTNNKKDPEGVISRSSQPISFIIVSCFVGRFERPFSWSPNFLGYLSAMKNFMSLSFFKESDLRQLASVVFWGTDSKMEFGARLCVVWLVMKTPSLVVGGVLAAPGMWQWCNC